MLTTGLLSLSVHEALTFDGTEIVLHPDLFVDPRRISTGVSGSPVITAPAGGQGILPLHRSASSDNSLPHHAPHLDIKSSYPDDVKQGSTYPSGANIRRRIEKGNMLEIRVWDALPGAKRSMSPPSSARRTLPPTPGLAMPSESSSNEPLFRNGSTNASLHISVNIPSSSTLAFQYADESSLQPSGVSEHVSGDESTESSGEPFTKDAMVTSSLPSSPKEDHRLLKVELTLKNAANGTSAGPSPLPPRHRACNSDVIPRMTALALNKSPFWTRGRAPNPLTNSDTRHHSAPKPPLLAGSHMRDISDMTMETFTGNQLLQADSGLESNTSQDDEDDPFNKISRTHTLRLSFVMLVTEKSLTSLASTARTQVSLLRQVAELYNISSYDMVTVNRIEKSDEGTVLEAVSADFVTVTIQDQFIGRGDMYLFQKSLIGRWIYEGERIQDLTLGIKANSREIRHKNRLAKSGIITERSVITFRSRSARIMWLVQLSSEMWDYASPYEKKGSGELQACELYFEKFVRFMYKLFKKWKDLKVSHSLTVVFFSRTFISCNQPGLATCMGGGNNFNVDVYGRRYEDHYKTIVENETNTDWDKLIYRIKQEFVQFPMEVGWNLKGREIRQPSNATQGNVLEAINVCLNLLQFHYLDRDLHRTGNSIVLVSPSSGVFEVDKGLAGITLQRMMDNGIGSDMLSLGLPPLHIAPFFLYNHAFHSVDTQGVIADHTYYEVPHWMHLSFVSYDSEDLPLEEHEPGMLEKARASKPEEGPAYTMAVAANGFLLPEIRNRQGNPGPPTAMNSSPSKSFSAMANIAASPKPNAASQSRQRALIEGRDFQDILEACRPRQIQIMPSALTFQLKMKKMQPTTRVESIHRVSSDDSTENNVTIHHGNSYQTHESFRLKEWGTVDFDDLLKPPLLSDLSSAPKFGIMSMQESESSGKSAGSITSSFASQLSNALGKSFDHGTPQSSFLVSLPIPPVSRASTGIQLQKSPSLEFESFGETESIFSENSRSDSSLSTHEPDEYGAKSLAVNERPVSSPAFDENIIRRLMRQYDKNYFKTETQRLRPTPAINGANPVGSSSSANFSFIEEENPPLSSRYHPNNSTENRNRGGGLGAALTQFNTESESSGIHPDLSSSAMQRIVSSVHLSHLGPRSLGRMDSMNRPKSPYFMPPQGLLVGAGSGVPPDDIPRQWHLQRMSEANIKLPSVHAMQLVRRDSEKAPRHGLLGDKREIPMQVMSRSIVKPYRAPNVVSKSPTEGQSPPRHASLSRSLVPTKNKKDSLNHARHIDAPKEMQSTRQGARRQKGAFNPFRQRDEEEELAKKSHNRRRWSHVFPLGEVEFKRHSGPSWKSLCQPAILPLTVDYLPPLRDAQEFDVHPYQVTLFGSEQSHYTTHKELFLEMVRHRLTQDYQVVPTSVVAESSRRDKFDYLGSGPRNYGMINPQNIFKGSLASEPDNVIQHTLSMGHRVHILAYNANSDTIDVTIYNKKISTKLGNGDLNSDDTGNLVINYRYLMYSPATLDYTPMTQGFKKYSKLYKWNAVDHTLGDDRNKSLEPGMRFRRLMFSLIPPKFNDALTEQTYIEKFKRLLEYLGKLREKKGAAPEELTIHILSVADERPDPLIAVQSARHGTTEERDMKRFIVDLRKGNHDLYEWLEIALDAVFDTTRTYRLMINWLVASSSKVETQVQLLHRRCIQYGLKLHSFPQTAISRNLFLSPYRPPPIMIVREVSIAKRLYQLLLDHNFVDDGIHMTRPNFLSCVEDSTHFSFRRNRNNEITPMPGRQYVHRSTGALFVRLIRDQQGWAIMACIINYQVAADVKGEAIKALGKLNEGLEALGEAEESHDATIADEST